MRFLANLFAAVFLIAAAIFFIAPYALYPRPNPNTPAVARVQDSPNIEEYVRESEAKFADEIKPGLEKQIVWFDPSIHEKTKISLVYFHGWSASRRDTYPAIEILARRLQANVFYTRLQAHGLKDGSQFAKLKMQDLIDDAREALAIGQKIGEHVVLVGMSTGATLALEQAYERQSFKEPVAVIMLSPNFMPLNKKAKYLTGPLGRVIARLAVGMTYSFPAENPRQAGAWTTSYPSEGLVPMMDLVNYTNSLELQRVHTPALILYTHLDQLVSITAMHQRFARLASMKKEMFDLEEATRHELIGDIFGKRASIPASDAMTDFIRETIAEKDASR